MNVFVTNKCIKHCSFCFNTKMDGEEPSLEKLKDYVDRIPPGMPAKLLGGEPTLHPEFSNLLRHCLSSNRQVMLFSNLLTDHRTWKEVADLTIGCQPGQFSLVANSTELYGERWKTFRENLELFRNHGKAKVTFSYTIGEAFDSSCIDFDYLKEFLKGGSHEVRLSCQMPFPGSESIVIGNEKLGANVVEFMDKLGEDLFQRVNFDCLLLPCWFSENDWAKYKFLRNDNGQFCKAAPFDVFVCNDAAIYGLCCQDIECSIDDVKTIDVAKVTNRLTNRYHAHELALGVPKICRECRYFGDECGGGCLPMRRQILK